MIRDLAIWLIGPALLVMAVIGGIRLAHDIANYSGIVTGHAYASECVTTPGAMFNDCVPLHAEQIEDLR